MLTKKESKILQEFISEVSIKETPIFPLHVLPEMFQDFAKTKASSTSINVAAPAAAIFFIASYLGHGLTYALRSKDGIELYENSICTLWFSLFFPSGAGKSESTKFIHGLLKEFGVALRNKDKFKSDESVYEIVKDYTMYTTNTTVEACMQAVGNEGNFGVYTDEIETFLRSLVDSKGDDKVSPMMSIWSGQNSKRLRVNAQSKTKDNDFPNLPILAFGQCFSAVKLFQGDRVDSGFLQRWLPVYDNRAVPYVSLADKAKNKARINSKSEKKAYASFITAYEKALDLMWFENGVIEPNKPKLYTNAEGFAFCDAVHRNYSNKQRHFESVTNSYSAIYSKAVEQFLRLACCLWVLDSIAEGSFWDKEPVLNLDILGRAYELNSYFIKNHILIQKEKDKELKNKDSELNIDSIVLKFYNSGSFSINALSEMTGQSIYKIKKIINQNTNVE